MLEDDNQVPQQADVIEEQKLTNTVTLIERLEEMVEEKPEKRKRRERRRWWKHRDVNAGEASFATGLNLFKIIWIFIIGCFLGVVFETFYAYAMDGVWKRVSGMLYGPFNQVYGFGAVLFTLILYRFRKMNAFVIFLAAAIIGGAFEYLCSWIQQIFFGSQSWEYSDMPTSIGGRTNLFYMAGWGLMGLIFITHLWPWLSEMIERIPNKISVKRPKASKAFIITGKGITVIFAVALAVDLALTGAAVYRAGQRSEGEPATWFFARWLDATYPDDVMAERFPNMEFVGQYKTGGEDGDKASDG